MGGALLLKSRFAAASRSASGGRCAVADGAPAGAACCLFKNAGEAPCPRIFKDCSPAAGAVPKTLYGYTVIDPIGEGAGSTLYVVSDPKTRQLFALKHIVRSSDKDLRYIDQLQTEFEVGRQFTHPNLRKSIELKLTRTLFRRVTDAGLVLELFDGVPLDKQGLQPLRATLPHLHSNGARFAVNAPAALLALRSEAQQHPD